MIEDLKISMSRVDCFRIRVSTMSKDGSAAGRMRYNADNSDTSLDVLPASAVLRTGKTDVSLRHLV